MAAVARLQDAPPLFSLGRGGYSEQLVSGFTALLVGEQFFTSWQAGCDLRLPGRSLLKPWQYLATSGTMQSESDLLGIASHSGQAQHIAAIEAKMRRLNITDDQLVCSQCWPYDSSSPAALMPEQRQKKKSLFHFCSGKHLSLIAYCLAERLNPASYQQRDHPVQVKIRTRLEAETGAQLPVVTDSCGLPNYCLTACEQLSIWRQLATATDPASQVMVDLWRRAPLWTGGVGRLDTELMTCGEGRILAKEGADGLVVLQGVGDPAHVNCTLYVKVNHGLIKSHLALAIFGALKAHRSVLPLGFRAVADYLEAHFSEYLSVGQDCQPLA